MRIVDVVKCDETDLMVWKFPYDDLSTKTQLIVNESQEAIFFKDGQALDLFSAGRYTLETQNIPLLNKIINLPFGGESPFKAEIWFVNKKNMLDVLWGTPEPIQLEDPEYEIIVPVRANGQMEIRVDNSREFLIKLVGTARDFSKETLVNFFRGKLMSKIKDYVAEQIIDQKISILDITTKIQDISSAIKDMLVKDFEEYGIILDNFYVNAINVPEDDPSYVKLKEAKAERASMKAQGYSYQERRMFDVMEKAAQNEGAGGGNMSNLMGAGMGIGMGVNIGNAMGNTVSGMLNNPNPSGTAGSVCPQCNAGISAGTKFCHNCGAQIQQDKVTCSFCNQQVSKSKFCENCGKPLKRMCPKCAIEVEGNVKFCSNCGTEIK